ncbi:MAG: SMC-Scp complex subunit ScpB, partial [Acutalibacteraceae bacterium]
MDINEMRASVEAILFASGEAVPIDRICEATESDYSSVNKIVRILNDIYEDNHSALTILKLGDKYQMTTRIQFADIIRKALEIRRNQPLSQAAFEVLAIVAYKQPVTKAYIEQTRGVDCSGVITGLCEKGLIEESG